MDFLKARSNWRFVLWGLFFISVSFLAYYLHNSSTEILSGKHSLVSVYLALGLISVCGVLGLWMTLHVHAPKGLPRYEQIQLAIPNQNKKITESINYAKRIQSAILPNSRLIDRVLPDSFILYKPRDVVSGDFPWFAQVKNGIFMAAVDCTGHGVPGALLSLVGYFLLNDIVRSRRVMEPGKILDLLDEGVSMTLRTDEDAGTKDGMDISLCKINLEAREVEYAGAHRPLYIMRGGELEEIKGNKFPIGGGIFKNQTNFTNNKIKLSAGDSIYFCSDGFCDQFGGPMGKKFGTGQLRETIRKVHHKPMKEALQIFEHQWLEWKGVEKQTDDVMLIGVKF